MSVLIFSIGLVAFRLFLAVQNSYIHPDEHFQSLSIAYSLYDKIHNDLPWEFTNENPARSLSVVYLIYYPFFQLLQNSYSPLQILYIIRITICLVSWGIIEFGLTKISPSSTKKKMVSLLLINTSYVLLTYQCHTFSNSIETVLLMGYLMIISSVKIQMESHEYVLSLRSNKDDDNKKRKLTLESNYLKFILLGGLIVFGVFNRITFLTFLVLPSWYLFKFFFIYKKIGSLIAFGISLISSFVLLCVVETQLYEDFGVLINSTFKTTNIFNYNFIIPPLNNLIYNSNYSNISQHGIHSRLTHFFINLPQMLGPLYLILLVNFQEYFEFIKINLRYLNDKGLLSSMQKNDQYSKILSNNILYLSIISGIVLLSLIPHQELRFLIPLQPLLLKILDFEFLSEKMTPKDENNEKKGKSISVITSKNKQLIKNILLVWYIYNFVMSLLMGVFHQGGIVTALDYLYETPQIGKVQIWWRTYSPPTWVLGRNVKVVKYDNNFEEIMSTNVEDGVVIDVMGMEVELLIKVLSKFESGNNSTVLIAPTGSVNNLNDQNSIILKEIWNDFYHVDMDHLEYGQLMPGIGIYTFDHL